MEKLGPRDTTVPVRSAAAGLARSPALGICWVFPTLELTRLAKSPLTLGRGDECSVVLPGTETSRTHAELRQEGPIWLIRDRASTNGVFVDGRRVDEAPLEVGAVLRVGEWVGVVEAGGEAGALECPKEIAPGLVAGPGLRATVSEALRVAASEISVVIEGETGTGKDCFAGLIHAASQRTGAYVAVNCAALPESLAEAELFGYRRGAFTGAARDSSGYFRAAHGGTLFLDEVIELPLAIQAKLLRAIEAREVVPLGETRAARIDVRLVVAAQGSLADAVGAGRFRRDLYARLNGVTLELPPLRRRRSDAAVIFQRALAGGAGGRAPGLDPKLVERICTYEWPYNVRELVQTARRLLALHGDAPRLSLEHLPSAISAATGSESVAPIRPQPSERRRKRASALLERLAAALTVNRGNVSKACAELGISRQRAYRLLQQRPMDLEALRLPDDPDEGAER
ncbi:MAG: sigma 54-interacting transcriptional regulator [Myxococcales bacterium]|nr:sigma 54-interacting transcriptional regulator [Myxococcales bacterium]